MLENLLRVLTINRSLIRSIVRSVPSLPFLPFLPFVFLTIIRNQLNHEIYLFRNQWETEYDYVVVGAGSAGSVMAARLSEDDSATVLLLEAGMAENIISDVPMNWFNLQRTAMDWNFETLPQTRACLGMEGQSSYWARGKSMGGSSAINSMNYIRGNPRDYDLWSINGAIGWSWAEVFPYFIKTEDNEDSQYVSNGYHGIGGPNTVTSTCCPRLVSLSFLEAGLELGYTIGDLNGPSQSVFATPQRNIRNGERLSVAKAYLEPLVSRRNLHILANSFVTKILFDENKRAVGIEFDRKLIRHRVGARREVILSSGAINSPKILMLSGIGPKEHLQQMGIPVISDLRVGDNLQEHYLSGVSFTVNHSIGVDLLVETNPLHIYDYFLYKNNSLTNNLIEGMAFIKTKYADSSDDWPDIQVLMLPGELSVATGHGITQFSEQLNNYSDRRFTFDGLWP